MLVVLLANDAEDELVLAWEGWLLLVAEKEWDPPAGETKADETFGEARL